MKERIKIDTSLVVFLILLTSCLFLKQPIYLKNRFWDNIFDVVGIILILKGILIRMFARGHKRAYSAKSEALVTTGLYSLIRNPMYLGSFLLGSGFIFLLWPFWMWPLFAFGFYLRFNPQMIKEEAFLKKKFGTEFEFYCARTPRLIPSLKNVFKVESKKVLNFREAFSTKEKWSLFSWLTIAFFLEIMQEKFLFGSMHLLSSAGIFLTAVILYGLLLFVKYRWA